MADNSIILNTELRLDENKLRQSVQRIEQQLKFRGPFANMATDVSRFDHELNRATQRVITLGTAFQLLGTAARTIRAIATSTVEVEKALTDINSVFRLTNDNLSKFSGTLFNIARETAKTFDEVSKAAVEFSRQGLSVQKTQEAVRAAMILSRDANIDVAVSVRALTAAVNSFQKEGIGYGQVINRLAAADSAFAVSSKDLQEALIRVGSAASDVGVSFNELIALVTSAQQITARGGSVIAGALNTIFTRINRRDTLDALEALGVAISDTQGRMLPTLNVLQNFAKAYDKMTGSVKNQAAELVGGVRQLNTLKAVLDDLGRSNSVFAQTIREVENAQDNAERRNAARNQSLSAQLAQMRENGRQIGANIGSLGFESQAKGLVGILNNNPVTEALRNAGNLQDESFGAEAGRMFIKGFGNAIIFGLAPILAGIGVKVSKTVFGNLMQDAKDATLLKNVRQEQANLEKQIIALYQSGGSGLQRQLATMTSLNQQAAVFAGLMSKVQAGSPAFSSRDITAILYAQGTRAARTPRAAGGYVPFAEEASAISRGTGGAPSSARPVYLPNFNRGGGQKGIVANTSEFIVPHMAGGSAIFNRDMIQKYGLPPGATPVAAEGFIPTASFGWYMGQRPTTGYPYNLAPVSSMYGPPAAPNIVPGGVSPSAMGAGFGQYQYIPPFIPHFGSFGPGSSMYGGTYMPGGGLAGAGGQGFGQYAQNVFSHQMAASLLPTFYINKMMAGMGSALPATMKGPPMPPLSFDEQVLERWGPQTSRGGIDPNYKIKNPAAEKAARAVMEAQEKRLLFLGKRDIERIDFAYNRAMEEWRSGSGLTDAKINLIKNRLAQEGRTKVVEMYGPGARQGAINTFVNQYVASRIDEGNAMAASAIAARNAPPPSLMSRLRSPLTPSGMTKAMIAGMALPFAGSMIDPGEGGTSSGMWRGAASTGLSMAGFGASAGMMTGTPLGVIAGAGIGGVLGALIGVAGKLTKSFEELSAELDKSEKALAQNYEKSSQFLRLEEERQSAIESGDRAKKLQIERTQTQLLAEVTPDISKRMLSWRANPQQGLVESIRQGNEAMAKQRAEGSLRGSLTQLISGKQDQTTASGLTSVMATMKPEGLAELEKRINSGDISGALTMLTAAAGGGDAEAQSLIQKIAAQNAQTGETVAKVEMGMAPMNAIRTALASVGSIGGLGSLIPGWGLGDNTSKNVLKALGEAYSNVSNASAAQKRGAMAPGGLRPKQISGLISRLGLESIQAGVAGSAEQQLFQAAQAASLGQPMSERDRLVLEGRYSTDAISFQSQIGQSQMFAQGRLGVSQSLQAAGVKDKGLFQRAGNLNSIDAVLAFSQALNGKELSSAIDPGKIETIKSALDEMARNYFQISETEKANLDVVQQIAALKLEEFDLEKDYNRVRQRLLIAAEEEAERRESASLAVLGLRGSPFISGSQIESGLMGGAINQGMWGNARGSFVGGFQARFAGLKQDMLQFAEIGNRVAQSLESNLGNAFGDFVTGATTAKNAFRSFAISVLSDSSRMFASKAFQTALSAIPGFTPMGATGGEFTGSSFKFAAGGMVPALLTGGEFYVSPRAAKRIGYDTLRQLNRYAEGGVVRGGSGVKDDVPAKLPPGSFIIRKSATERLGSDYLQSLVEGRVQGRFLGGFLGMPMLYGALLGGGLGALAGGKKGALIGAGVGAIGGGLYGMYGAAGPASSGGTHSLLNVSTPSPDLAAVAAEPATMMSPFNVSASRMAQAAGGSWMKTAGYGLGMAAALGLAAKAFSPKDGPGPLSASQIPAFRSGLEAEQDQLFSKNRYAYLTVNPQGGYSLGSFGPEAATRRWSDGGTVSGGVDMAVVPGPHGGSGPVSAPQVSVKIEINNNGQVSSKSGSTGGDDGPFGADFGQKLEKSIRPIVQDELIRQSRNDGFFSQRSRYMNG